MTDSHAPILALDFGGTKNTCAAFELDARGAFRITALERRASPPQADAAYDYATMLDLARTALAGAAPQAIGISFGGPVRASEGLVMLSHHVPGWERNPLAARVHAELGARVVMDNDANAAALGEALYGAGAGCRSVFYITVSTGVGGGWALDGKIYRGANELAGEIGHMVIDPAGPLCMCGRRGCIEQYASGPSIARMARERLQADTRQRTLESQAIPNKGRAATEWLATKDNAPQNGYLPQDGSRQTPGAVVRQLVDDDLARITGQVVNTAAEMGDPLARDVMHMAAYALGLGIGSVTVLMNPERVILGGGVTKAGAPFFEAVRAAARANVMPELRDHVHIVPAGLGDDAPLWGALALVSSPSSDCL